MPELQTKTLRADVPVGQVHTVGRYVAFCTNRRSTELPAGVTEIRDGHFCPECRKVVHHDSRPVVTAAVELIRSMVDGGMPDPGVEQDLPYLVQIFEQGAAWLLAQQSVNARDLGVNTQ